MIEEHWALRDEIVNFHAMAIGGLPNDYSHQIFICKKSPIKKKEGVPFLLDQKKTNSTRYNLSKIGMWYYEKVKKEGLPLRYAAYIDLQVEIKINIETFTELAEKGFFSVWSPTAPVDYFEGNKTGYLVIFRIYKLTNEIDESLLYKGRAGKNYLYRLTGSPGYEFSNPIIENKKYDKMKQDLISLLKTNGSFIGFYK